MAHMVSLKMDMNTLDVLAHAVDVYRNEVVNNRLPIPDNYLEDTMTEIQQLDYLMTVAYKELKDAKSKA